MDVDITLEQAMRKFHPVMIRGDWWVDLGDGPRGFQSLKTARAFIKRSHERRNRCLYANCLLEGEEIPGMGVGFRFCEKHRRNAQKVLTKRRPGSYTKKRLVYETV